MWLWLKLKLTKIKNWLLGKAEAKDMSLSILKIRDREKYKEVICYDSATGKDYTFSRKESYKDEQELLTWAEGLVTKIKSNETDIKAEIEAIKAVVSDADFMTWLDKNKDRSDVAPYIYKLAEIYKLQS